MESSKHAWRQHCFWGILIHANVSEPLVQILLHVTACVQGWLSGLSSHCLQNDDNSRIIHWPFVRYQAWHFHTLFHSNLPTTLRSRFCYLHSHCTDGKTELQGQGQWPLVCWLCWIPTAFSLFTLHPAITIINTETIFTLNSVGEDRLK